MKCKSTYASEEAYRAAKRRQSERYRARTGSGRYRNPWTAEQLCRVMAHEQSDRELSDAIGHSVAAIQTARHRVRRGVGIHPRL